MRVYGVSSLSDREYEEVLRSLDSWERGMVNGSSLEASLERARYLVASLQACFAGERASMLRVAYPELGTHVQEHDRILGGFEMLQVELRQNKLWTALELGRQFRELFVAHHHDGDLLFKNYLSRFPEPAYARKHGPPTTP